MYSGITSGRVLDGELLHTKILEVDLFAFAYRLFHHLGAASHLESNLNPIFQTSSAIIATRLQLCAESLATVASHLAILANH